MSLETVKQTITKWLHSDNNDDEANNNFVQAQFEHELTANGMMSTQYRQINQGLKVNMEQLFRQIMLLK